MYGYANRLLLLLINMNFINMKQGSKMVISQAANATNKLQWQWCVRNGSKLKWKSANSTLGLLKLKNTTMIAKDKMKYCFPNLDNTTHGKTTSKFHQQFPFCRLNFHLTRIIWLLTDAPDFWLCSVMEFLDELGNVQNTP